MKGSKSPRPLPAKDILNELLSYSIVTGELRWKKESLGKHPHRINEIAGQQHSNGLITIQLLNNRWRSHRIIWMMVTGEDPGAEEVDHADGFQGNNAWLNLRIATRSEQLANRCRPRNNLFGVKGVHMRKDGKWVATLHINGESYWLGSFVTFQDAVDVRLAAEAKFYGNFSARGRGNV